MAVRLLPLLLFLSLAPSGARANPLTPPTEPHEASQRVEHRADSRLIHEAFQSQFSKEQLRQFGKPPTIDQLVQSMSPEQRQGARAKLGELERNAKTPADFEQIAKGYLMLDERSPEAGKNAARVAAKIRQLEPEKSTGFTLAASGFHQMGDYPAAAEWAKQALERNPNDTAARAVYMLSIGRVKRSGPGLPGVAAPGPEQATGFNPHEWVIPEKDVSAEALGFMKQAVAARRAGEMDKTMALAQAAMNADPTSSAVQGFYEVVKADNRKYAETGELLRLSKEALDAGRTEDAVALAQRAYERSGNPTVKKILELTQQMANKRTQEAAKEDLEPKKKAPANGSLPLWPIGAGLGLAAIGYGVARSRGTWSEQESEKPENEDPNSERIQENRRRLKMVAISAAVGFGIVYGGPIAVRAAAPLVTALLRGVNASLQRKLASEVGALNPGEAQALTNAAKASQRLIPGFNAVESQVINEAQLILSSPEFAKLEEAYRAGRPVVVNIGGRLIQYEPDIPMRFSAITNFQMKGFAMGRQAFSSANEMRKTVLHELYRLATSQSSGGISGTLADREEAATHAFVSRAAGAL